MSSTAQTEIMLFYQLKRRLSGVLTKCFLYLLAIFRVFRKLSGVAVAPTIGSFKVGKTSILENHAPVNPPQSAKCSDKVEECIPLPPPSINDTKVLDIDIGTPDAHVPRDPRLIRLTGVHPFNVEAPLSALFDSGFLTPPELFYVRNHGAVPKVPDEEALDWSITIEGLVENPVTLTLRQILSEFEQVTLPITLVCAGNRRKEQNQIQKSQGFSWGAAGVSTSLFTGPLLADVLRVAKPLRNARYLCMEGADELPNGKYGTSVRLSQVMDEDRAIMLAHKMNGEPLRPDHGRPLRVVVPSMIGGRSVKWLKRLILSQRPSENWYHIYDNRVLPTMVTPEMAKLDRNWWQDERYAIYDLSVNSVVAYPAHDELLRLGLEPDNQKYTIKGYAYTGGGRRVTRVEISLDKGQSWNLAQVSYPEDLYRNISEDTVLFGGRVDMSWRDACLCWCFWSLDVSITLLSNAEDIVVRAMDDSMNRQPRDTYWSVLGMMHNSWFRVAIRNEEGGQTLRFEHPTQPALQKGGWMERVKNEGGDLRGGNWGEKADGAESTAVVEVKKGNQDLVRMTNDSVKRIIDINELNEHSKGDEPWFVVDGEVYDGSKFLGEHPGGATSIRVAAGLDVTDEFMGIHSENAKLMMPKYHIGSLSKSSHQSLLEQSSPSAGISTPSETFLNPRSWLRATLMSKKEVSWDTKIFTFNLETPEQTLGLPVGQHLLLKIKNPTTGESVTRPYTPISQPAEKGVVHVLVKIYFDTPTTKGGEMSTALDKLPMGSAADFKGPIGKLIYHGQGNLSILDIPRKVDSFLMICAGSGITPIFQVLRAVLADPTDATNCVVLNGNRQEEDILCKEDLDEFVQSHPDRCKIVYTLTKPGKDWEGEIGRIDGDLIKRHTVNMSIEGRKPMVLVCGPGPLEKSVRSILSAAGWGDRDMVFF